MLIEFNDDDLNTQNLTEISKELLGEFIKNYVIANINDIKELYNEEDIEEDIEEKKEEIRRIETHNQRMERLGHTWNLIGDYPNHNEYWKV